MSWTRAVGLVLVGLVLMGVGAAEIRPASTTPATPQRIVRLDEEESLREELLQRLDQYVTCRDTGVWDQWPCTQWWPDGHHR